MGQAEVTFGIFSALASTNLGIPLPDCHADAAVRSRAGGT